MEKSTLKISAFFLILGLCLISVIGNSQELNLSIKEKREIKKAERLKDFDALGALLESKRFAYETERVQGSTGTRVYNVTQVDGLRIYVRCDDPPNTSGRFSGAIDNSTLIYGRTGLFFEGDIENWELSNNSKNLSYSIRLDAKTSQGIVYEIFMKINSSKSASIEIKNRSGTRIFTNYTGLIRNL